MSFEPDEFLKIYDTDKAVQEIMLHYKDIRSYYSKNVGGKYWKQRYDIDKKEVNNLFKVLYKNLDKIG